MKRFLTMFLFFLSVPSYADEAVFVAIGYGGRRMISEDGLNWKITAEWAQPGGDDGNNLMSAVFAEGKFVAVGGGGGGKTGAGHILVSTDGRTWKEPFTDKSRVNPIVHGNGRFVVGTSSYPSGRLMWSDDAEKWTKGAQITERGLTHFRGGAFGNNVFVLVGNGRTKQPDGTFKEIHWSVASPDGETITGERTDLPGHGTIVFGAGQFLMLTSHTDADLISSTNGLEWKPVTVADKAKHRWLVWTGSTFLVGGKAGVFASVDGKAWKQTEFTAPRGNVKWSDGTRFIASGWPGKMSFSLNGRFWKESPPLTANGINRAIPRTVESPSGQK